MCQNVVSNSLSRVDYSNHNIILIITKLLLKNSVATVFYNKKTTINSDNLATSKEHDGKNKSLG